SNEIRARARLASARIAIHKGDHPGAIEELETALTLLIHRDRPLLAAHVRLDLARALAGEGDGPAAAVEAEAALATFRRHGLVPDVGAAEEVLSSIREVSEGEGASSEERVPRLKTGTVESITPREQEVAEL